MTSNWTPQSLTALDPDKKPYIWLDCSSSNVTLSSDLIVSGLRDLTGNGYDMLSMQDYDQQTVLIPRQINSKKINDLKTVTFVKPTFYTSSGLTQPLKVEKFNTLTGFRAGIVLVARQGEVPGTLFGLNQKYDSNTAVTASNYPNPWRFKRTSTNNQYIANGNFATSITSDATLFKTNSTSYVSSNLCNIPVPPSNTVYMLSISNLTGSNQIFNGFGFNCETLQNDGGAGPSNLNAWTGDFGELVVWQQSATDDSTLQTRVEGYMAHKWGLSDFLPSSHTHKSSAPSFSTAYPAPFGNTSGSSAVYPLLWLDASNPLSLQTKYVVNLTDKSSNGYNLQTRPECKRNIVWPTEGKLLNGLKTTRFTQWAGLTQPTSIENVSDLFFVGIQNAIPSNATNGWPQNLLGHDNYDDFGCSLGNFNLGEWTTNAREKDYSRDIFGNIDRRWYIVTCTSAATDVVNASGFSTLSWSSTITPGGNNNLYTNNNTLRFTVDIRLVSNNITGASIIPGGRVTTFGPTNINSGQFTHNASGTFNFDFSTVAQNQQLIMIIEVNDTNTQPSGTCSPGGTILITSQTPKLYVNTSFPTQTLNPTIYYQSNGALVHNNNFPPVGSPFILALKLPQTATQKITARFQGISYDSFNSNSGWTGDFAEMIVFKKKNLTENQSNLVLTYLANKWGFSLADSSPPVVLPNVKPFSDFTPLSFKPIVWYDSSDSQIAKSLQTFGTILNNNTVKCVSNGTDVSNVTPVFGISTAVVAGKLGAFSGLSGTGCSDRTINGLNTMYVDDETTLLYESSTVFGTSSNKLTNIFFVGRQGQYSGQFSQWNSVLTYSVNGGDNIVYKGYTFISLAISNNINQVPPVDGTSTSYWKPVVKYQTLFGNLGYNVANPSETSNSNNILLGGKVVTYFQSQISSNTTVTSVASQASNSTYALSANVFTKFTTGDSNVNSNLLKASAACYSINQLGTARYQTTSAATQFVKAVNMTAETVLFPAPASTFLLSVNGIQASGTQNTPFRGFFYDNVSSKDGWEGDFGEIITFTKNLTPQEILLVEGYLATKWGLQSGLPSTHPFLYSGNPGLTPCLTGYSPLYFGAIGADINSTNDKLNLLGLGLTLQIPQNSYTTSSLLSYLNSILPNSISVSYTDNNKLLWKNTNSGTCLIVTNTSQAATALGLEPPPSFFSIRPLSETTVQSPEFIYLVLDNFVLTVSENSGSFLVRMILDYSPAVVIDFPVSLASHQFPPGKYSGSQLAETLQIAVQTQTGIAINVDFNYQASTFDWSIDPFFMSTTALAAEFQILSSNSTTCGLLGLEVSTPVYITYNNVSANPSVGDATFGSDQGIFEVSSSNNTYTVNTLGANSTLTLTQAIYETPESFLAEVNTELYTLFSQSKVILKFVYNPYNNWFGRNPGYYALYTYVAYTDESGTILTSTSNGADLLGLSWNGENEEGQIEFYGNNHLSPNFSLFTSTQEVTIPEASQLSIVGHGSEVLIHLAGSPIAPYSGGQCDLYKFVAFLQHAITAGFLPRGTSTSVSFVNGSYGVPASSISSLNAALALIPTASNLSVSNVDGYMVWSNSGSNPLVMVPSNAHSSSNLGFSGSLNPFTIFPNSFFSTGDFTNIVKSPNALTTTPAPFIIVPQAELSFTRTINSSPPTSTSFTLPGGILTPYQYWGNASSFLTQLDSNNYTYWSNSTPTTFTQTISVSADDPVSALALGFVLNGENTRLQINTSVTLGSSKPYAPGASVNVSQGFSNTSFSLSNSSYPSPNVLGPSIGINNYSSVIFFAQFLNSALNGTGLSATFDPNVASDPVTGLPSSLLWSNSLSTTTTYTGNIFNATLLGLVLNPSPINLAPGVNTFPYTLVSNSSSYIVTAGVNDTFYVGAPDNAPASGGEVKVLSPGTYTPTTFGNAIQALIFSFPYTPNSASTIVTNGSIFWSGYSSTSTPIALSAASAGSSLLLGLPQHYNGISYSNAYIPAAINPTIYVPTGTDSTVTYAPPFNDIVYHVPAGVSFSISDGVSRNFTYSIPEGTFSTPYTPPRTHFGQQAGERTGPLAFGYYVMQLFFDDFPKIWPTYAGGGSSYFNWQNVGSGNTDPSTYTITSLNSQTANLLGIPTTGISISVRVYLQTTATGSAFIIAGGNGPLLATEENMDQTAILLPASNYSEADLVSALNSSFASALKNDSEGFPTSIVGNLGSYLTASISSSTLSISNSSLSSITLQLNAIDAYQLGAVSYPASISFSFPANSSTPSLAPIKQSYYDYMILPTVINDTFQLQGIGLSPHTISVTFPGVTNGFTQYNAAIDSALGGTSGQLSVSVTDLTLGNNYLTSSSRFRFLNNTMHDITIIAGPGASALLGITSPLLITSAYARSHIAINQILIPVLGTFSGTVSVNSQTVAFGTLPTIMTPSAFADYLNGYEKPLLNVTAISFLNSGGNAFVTFTVPSTTGFGYQVGNLVTCQDATDDVFNGTYEVSEVTETTIKTFRLSELTGSHLSSTATLRYLDGHGFSYWAPNVSVSVAPGDYLLWQNRGTTAVAVSLNSAAGTYLGFPGAVSFSIPASSGRNISPAGFATTNTTTSFHLYGLDSPVPEITLVENGGSLQWTNNSAYNLTVTPDSDETSWIVGFSKNPEEGSSLFLPSSGSISPYPVSLTVFLSAFQTFSVYGTTDNSSTEITLVDGIYNAVDLSAMIQKSILTALGSTIVAVTYNISQKLTFTNLISTQITITGTLEFAKAIGLVSPTQTTAGTYTLTLLPNSSTLAPYPLSQVTLLNVCAWDGQESCPTNYTEVTSDSNELALPYAKRCAKPFSSLLPQVLTNAGLSNQSYSCPIGTELIGKNQNADPDHPVCSYVCDPPYYDSGTTCGYFPVYSPRDDNSINILNDNSSANVTEVNLADTSKGSTSSALRFMILAVIVSFLIGLAIKAFPTLTANPPTESAAGSVLESVIQSQGQGLKPSGKNADWPQNWRKGVGKR